jgi:hypothetical protein
MPVNPAFKASLAEWRTVLAAVRHYREHLAATAPGIENEDKQLIAYDDVERLDRIIPNFERQLNEETQEQRTTLAS